jgi:hypothetical protein
MVFGAAAGAVSQLIQEHRYRPQTSHGASLRPRRTRVKRSLGRDHDLSYACDTSHWHRLELSVDQTLEWNRRGRDFGLAALNSVPTQETQEQMLHARANVHSAPERVT